MKKTTKASKRTKTAKHTSTIPASALRIIRQFAALRAHTNKTFQSERKPAERAAQVKALRAFVAKYNTRVSPTLRERLAA